MRGTTQIIEWAAYLLLITLSIAGLIVAQRDIVYFTYEFVGEDGVIEWATVVFFGAAGLFSLYRAMVLRKRHLRASTAVALIIAVACFVVAGEEISWGQRIFGIQSTEWLLENNLQGETTIHNLRLFGISVMTATSVSLFLALIIYLVPVPLLYGRNRRFRDLLNRLGVPVPRVRHRAMVAVLAVLNVLINRSGSATEIFEMSGSVVFFFIVVSPMNSGVFMCAPHSDGENK